MYDYLLDMLQCPVCSGQLAWTVIERRGSRIEAAEATCTGCHATYPVREGIGVFLTPDLPRRDLWQEVDSQLNIHLSEHPDLQSQLLDLPLESLNPADRQLRALVLEERGRYLEAQAAADSAREGLYSPDYLACHSSQVRHVLDHLSELHRPVVDLASGRCELVGVLAAELKQHIVATDFSPRVLCHDRRWLEHFSTYEHVSLLAFDARRMPFKDAAIETMTTNLGLANIEGPGDLVHELKRVVSGDFLSISHFYPEGDEANATAIRELRLAPFLFRASALELFTDAGFEIELRNVRRGKALPTPESLLFKGAGIDALPVAETELEWCVLVAR
jgi:uncharacterized protein YbaR (Trm112 family)